MVRAFDPPLAMPALPALPAMPAIPPPRYLQVRPRGIAQWMTQPPGANAPEGQLFRHLLRAQAPPAVDVGQLSEGSGLARAQVAQSLFCLQRSGSIRVCLAPPPPRRPPRGAVADLQPILQRLCSDGPHTAVLADADGLCVASHGLPPDDAQAVAATQAHPPAPTLPLTLPLYVGRRPCRLHSSADTPLHHDALVELLQNLYHLLAPPP